MSQQQATRDQHIEWLRRSPARRDSQTVDDQLAHAWEVARQVAQLLREKYAVTRVRAFGSLVHPRRFHTDSDIDLAVEGLSTQVYWDALADALFLDDETAVDLVDPDTCPPAIWERVEREGVDL